MKRFYALTKQHPGGYSATCGLHAAGALVPVTCDVFEQPIHATYGSLEFPEQCPHPTIKSTETLFLNNGWNRKKHETTVC